MNEIEMGDVLRDPVIGTLVVLSTRQGRDRTTALCAHLGATNKFQAAEWHEVEALARFRRTANVTGEWE